MMNSISLEKIRQDRGFLTIEELESSLNNIYDPYCTHITNNVRLGRANKIYPNVQIICESECRIEIGDGNSFYPGTIILASSGTVTIGSNNQFGPGGFLIQLNKLGSDIDIGNNCRFVQGPTLFGNCHVGNGAQVIGQIVVDSCSLQAGESHEFPHPDQRGAVLKGVGIAKNLELCRGEVISSYSGVFSQDSIVPQSQFHPKKT